MKFAMVASRLLRNAALLLPCMIFLLLGACFPGESFAETAHIYIDQANGRNDVSTSGTEAAPFKSITFGMNAMKDRGAPDPWFVHIKPGSYDAVSSRPLSERETFPIELRPGLTLQGEGGAENCIISGYQYADSNSAILHAEDCTTLTIRNLTVCCKIHYIFRSYVNGSGAELVQCSGTIEECIFRDNTAISGNGGGIWMSLPPGAKMDIRNNRFVNNSASSGGGIFITGDFSGNITGNLFSGNYANGRGIGYHNYSGGAICAGGAFIGDISYNDFKGNISDSVALGFRGAPGEAKSFGGGIAIQGEMIGEILHNSFDENKATSQATGDGLLSAYAYGGAFYLAGNFSGEVFHNNIRSNYITSDWSANWAYGGAFCFNGDFHGNISDNLISGNSCSTSYPYEPLGQIISMGGGIHVAGHFSGDIIDNEFNSNYAGPFSSTGGGFNLSGGITGNIRGNTFSGNVFCSNRQSKAVAFGGGFSIHGNIFGDISNNSFVNNRNNMSTYCSTCSSQNSSSMGAGFGVLGSLNGEVNGNMFSRNLCHSFANSNGGGFGIAQSMNGGIINNVFFENLSSADTSSGSSCTSSSSGGGFGILGNLGGNITGNTFVGNISTAQSSTTAAVKGGGFYVKWAGSSIFCQNTLSGNVCTASSPVGFSSSGGGFCVEGLMNGPVYENLLANNKAQRGGGCALEYAGSSSWSMTNNYFISNQLSGSNALNGAAIFSNQEFAMLHNTFIGHPANQGVVYLASSASDSSFSNDLFSSASTAIALPPEMNVPINNCTFDRTRNALYANSEYLGNDLEDIQRKVASFQNNHNWEAGFRGENAALGILAAPAEYDAQGNLTLLAANDPPSSGSAWTPGQWKGAFVVLDPLKTQKIFPVDDNTSSRLALRGDLTGMGDCVSSGGAFIIRDYRLAEDSPNVDAATTSTLTSDFAGEIRPFGAAPDIGADEFTKGPVAGARDLPANYTPWRTLSVSIRIQILADEVPANLMIEETPPLDWEISNISDGGRWAPGSGNIQWGPWTNGDQPRSRTLTYQLTPSASAQGIKNFSGIIWANGNSCLVSGNNLLSPSGILPTATPSPSFTATPSPSPTATRSPSSTDTPSPSPTAPPSSSPTPPLSPLPTASPSSSPTAFFHTTSWWFH